MTTVAGSNMPGAMNLLEPFILLQLDEHQGGNSNEAGGGADAQTRAEPQMPSRTDEHRKPRASVRELLEQLTGRPRSLNQPEPGAELIEVEVSARQRLLDEWRDRLRRMNRTDCELLQACSQ